MRTAGQRTGDVTAVLVVVWFVAVCAIKLFPFANGLPGILEDTGNDWGTYATFALDVKRNGILMPSVEGPYIAPASFLYVYFLAGSFALFGDNSVPVFFLQTLLLGLAVALTYWTFRDRMRPAIGLAFLGALAFFAFVDVNKYYSFRFLGENLALFTIALFFYLFIKGIETNSLGLQLSAAATFGITILIRPNVWVYGVVVALGVIWHSWRQGRAGVVRGVAFAVVLAVSSSFLAYRNHAVAGTWLFLPTQGGGLQIITLFHPIPASVDLSGVDTSVFRTRLHLNRTMVEYAEYVRQAPLVFAGHYVKKVLFCFGFLPAVNPAYQYRPHWMLMWIGYFSYLLWRIRDARNWETWEWATQLFVLCYYGVLILAAPIDIYGFRYLVPATNTVLALAFIGLDRMTARTLAGAPRLVHVAGGRA